MQDYEDLYLQPSAGGIINVFLFRKCVGSYQIMGCRKNWPELLKCVWEHCHNFEVLRMKRERQSCHLQPSIVRLS